MTTASPLIGFDRFIQLEWVRSVLKIRAGISTLEELNKLLETSLQGKEARAKTRTKLNALGLQPTAALSDFAGRGSSITQNFEQDDKIIAFAWGTAIATYPFFGKIVEIIGRLTALQGDCSVMEIHRRMSEVYGDREITKRATQAVLQSLTNWGVIERVEAGKRIIRCAPTAIDNDGLTSWLVEAAVRYINKPISVTTLQSLPVLFPFDFTRPLGYVVSNDSNLVVRSEGPSNQYVDLRAAV